MKRNLLITAAVLVAMTLVNFKASAQTSGLTGTVALDITLSDALAIVFPASQDVHFVYANAADYGAEKSVPKNAHFKVISTKPYNITVGASAFTSSTVSTPPDLGIVAVSIASATPVLATPGFTAATQVPLSPGGAPLVSLATASIGTTYNIVYKIADATTLLGKLTGTVFSTNVLYTVTAP